MVALATRVVPCNSTSSGKWPFVSIAGPWHPICEITGWITGVCRDSHHSWDANERANLTAPHQHCKMRALARSNRDRVDLVPRVPHGSRSDASRAPHSYSRSRRRALLSHSKVVPPTVAPTTLTPPPPLLATIVPELLSLSSSTRVPCRTARPPAHVHFILGCCRSPPGC